MHSGAQGADICLLSHLPGVIPNFSFSPGDLPLVPAPLTHRDHWGEPPGVPTLPHSIVDFHSYLIRAESLNLSDFDVWV